MCGSWWRSHDRSHDTSQESHDLRVCTYLGVDGGDHRHGNLEDGFVPVDPLEAGQSSIRGDLGVGVGWVVSRDTEVEVSQLDLAHL